MAATTPASAATTPTLYFGYGSNLWKAQMLKRCPQSQYQGIARLSKYRWLINSRGYANVVESPYALSADEGRAGNRDVDVVWGLIYSLTPADEESLDRNEGVPVAYTKELLTVDFWPADSNNDEGRPDVQADPEKRDMLVYIDRRRTEPDEPKREYVYRMNMGIRDAVAEGMPRGYVDGVMRSFIPEEDADREAEGLAKRQAEEFVDEN